MLFSPQKSTHAVVVTLFIALSQYSYGQQIPPACAQLTRAAEVCATDFHDLEEIMSPSTAKDNGFDPKQMEKLIRATIQKEGAQVVAERCATERAKNELLRSLSNIASAMGMLGGDPRRCMRAFQQIR